MVYRDMPFNQMLGIPVELQLRPTDEGLRLCSEPVRELKSLRGKSHAIKRRPVRAGDNPLAGIGGELFEVIVDISLGDATEITFYLRGVPVIYHVKKQQLSCEGRTGPLKEANGAIKLRMLVDRTSIDIFGNDGHLYMPMCMRISPDNRSFSMEVAGGSATINSLEIVELKSCWN
jgi:sucrose-6-phosphate hydrolase SacC (GH32 family)